MHAGRIVAVGTHLELTASSQLYSELFTPSSARAERQQLMSASPR
jgi:hypothetical protein